MHITTIDLGTFSDLNDQLRDTHRHDDDVQLVTIGRHPDLGRVVIVQGIEGLVMVSQLPAEAFPEEQDERSSTPLEKEVEVPLLVRQTLSVSA